MFGVCNDPISFFSLPSDSLLSIQSLDDGGVFCLFGSVLSSVCKSMFNLIRRNNTAHAAQHEGLGKFFILLLLLLLVVGLQAHFFSSYSV